MQYTLKLDEDKNIFLYNGRNHTFIGKNVAEAIKVRNRLNSPNNGDITDFIITKTGFHIKTLQSLYYHCLIVWNHPTIPVYVEPSDTLDFFSKPDNSSIEPPLQPPSPTQHVEDASENQPVIIDKPEHTPEYWTEIIKSMNNKLTTSGWICPKCGAGVSPHTIICPCTPKTTTS